MWLCYNNETYTFWCWIHWYLINTHMQNDQFCHKHYIVCPCRIIHSSVGYLIYCNYVVHDNNITLINSTVEVLTIMFMYVHVVICVSYVINRSRENISALSLVIYHFLLVTWKERDEIKRLTNILQYINNKNDRSVVALSVSFFVVKISVCLLQCSCLADYLR